VAVIVKGGSGGKTGSNPRPRVIMYEKVRKWMNSLKTDRGSDVRKRSTNLVERDRSRDAFYSILYASSTQCRTVEKFDASKRLLQFDGKEEKVSQCPGYSLSLLSS